GRDLVYMVERMLQQWNPIVLASDAKRVLRVVGGKVPPDQVLYILAHLFPCDDPAQRDTSEVQRALVLPAPLGAGSRLEPLKRQPVGARHSDDGEVAPGLIRWRGRASESGIVGSR